MKRSQTLGLLLWAALLPVVAPVAAEESSWWNPFSSGKPTVQRSAASNVAPASSWWKPKLWNPFSSLSTPAAPKPAGPTMWQRVSTSVSSTTRTVVNYTSTALQPWKWGRSANQPLTGTRKAKSWHNEKQVTQSSWNPFTWFASKPAPREPATVSEFLNMKRARF